MPQPPFTERSAAVLIADDVDATRSGLAELLRLRGHTVYEARNGAEALDVLRQHPDTRAIVLDVAMPDTDGYWFRDHQRQDPTIAHIPVIVFTGTSSTARLEELEAADVLIKPFAVGRVCEVIERHCA